MRDDIGNFFAAVRRGTLTGGGPFMLLTVPIAIFDIGASDPLHAVLVALSPLMISAGIVLTACVVIGLPVTWLFATLRIESVENYTAAGAFGGVALPISLAILSGDIGKGGEFVAILGIFAGAMTGYRWGRWREQRASDDLAGGQTLRPRSKPEKWSH